MIHLLIASLLWGPSFVLIPELLGNTGLNGYSLACLRMLFSVLLFLPLIRAPKSPRLTSTLIAVGAVQYGLMYITYLKAFDYMAPDEIALSTVFTPLYVALLIRMQDRKPACPITVSMVIFAVIGAGIIRFARPDSDTFWIGFGLMQASNLAFAFGQVFYRKLMAKTEGYSDMHAFGYLYLGAVITTTIAFFVLNDADTLREQFKAIANMSHAADGEFTFTNWAILLWLGLVPSGIGFFLWNHGAIGATPGALAIFNNLKIPFAMLVAFAAYATFLPEKMQKTNWASFSIGAVIMLAALAFNEWWAHRGNAGACSDPEASPATN